MLFKAVARTTGSRDIVWSGDIALPGEARRRNQPRFDFGILESTVRYFCKQIGKVGDFEVVLTVEARPVLLEGDRASD